MEFKPQAKPDGSAFWHHTRRRLFAGLVAVVPIAVTLFVATLVYRFVETLVGPFVNQIFKLPFIGPVPGAKLLLTILLSLVLLYGVGYVSSFIVIRQIYNRAELLLLKVPLLRLIYGMTKQTVDMLMRKDANALKQMVLFEYPRAGIYTLGFVTGETRIEGDPEPYVNIFLPTTPNPTNGLLFVLPESKVWVLEMSVEEGLKMIISGGMVAPPMLALQNVESFTQARKNAEQ